MPALGLVLVLAGCAGSGTAGRDDSANVVIDLVATFPLAESRSGSLTDLSAVDEDQLRDAGFGSRDGRLLGIGTRSRTEFYSAAPRPRQLTVQFDPNGWYRRLDPQVTIALNGTEITVLHRSDMREAHVIDLSADVVRAGINNITLIYGSARTADTEVDRPRGVLLQLALDAQAPVASASLLDMASSPRLRLPAGSRLEYFADIPAGSSLRLGEFEADDGGVALGIEFDQDGQETQAVIAVPGASAGDVPIELPTGPTRIALAVVPAEGSASAGGGIVIGDARIVHNASAALQGAGAPTPGIAAASPNVVIYLIDTLRADHLGLYGYGRPTSPNLDRFAEDAIVFETMQAQSSWTKPVVASIMTGLLPQQHGVQGREDNLAPDARSLASVLRLAGYATHAIGTNSTVFSDFNFDVGFNEFVELGERPTEEVHQLSDEVNRHFFDWLETRPAERPFFAFLHTTDPHEPYAPREPFRELLAADVLDPTITKGSSARRALEADPSLDLERVARDMARLYDAEIAFNDSQFGVLVDRLKVDGLYDSSLIIVLSDHGDEFLEHDGWSHGGTLYQEVLHVPLIVKLPEQARAGERVLGRAQHVDVFPTVMHVAGLDFGVDGPGLSLLDLDPAAVGRRPAISHLTLLPALQESVVVDALKLIRRAPPGLAVRTQLFDLADPGESQRVTRAITQAFLTSLLKEAALSGRAGSGGQLILDPEMTEQLRALGYIQD